MTDVTSIWEYPDNGALPDMTWLQDLSGLAEMFKASEAQQEAASAQVEAAANRQIESARAMGEQLRAQGIGFDIDKMLRPSLWERVQMWFDELAFSIREKKQPQHEQNRLAGVFAFSLPLAATVPTGEIPLEYDEIYAETARLRASVAQAISAIRGQEAQDVRLPSSALDDIFDADDWSEKDMLLDEISSLTHYWPPLGQVPAVALSERQGDGGLPIEIALYAHDAAAHREMMQLLEKVGGSLQ